ncbi:unnamed protein product [Amaranthus hypochondriacus]
MESMREKKEELKLLDAWASMFCMRVKIALAEKSINDYDCIVEDLGSAQKSSLLLEMNPIHKKIPVLIHNHKPICESMNIVEYIDEYWKGDTPFLSSHPYHRAQSRFWAHFVDTKFFEASNKLWRTKDNKEREEAKTGFIESLKTLEEVLGDKCYFEGDKFGYMDIALIPFYSWFQVYETCGSFNIELECPKIIAWGKRCVLRHSVNTSIPQMDKLSEFIMGIRKHYMGI